MNWAILSGDWSFGPWPIREVEHLAFGRARAVPFLPIRHVFGEGAGRLVGQVDPAPVSESHTVRAFQQLFQTDFEARLVEEDVAGMLDGSSEGQGPVSLFVPAASDAVAVPKTARARHRHPLGGGDRSGLQGYCGGRQLPGRARGVGPHHRPVVERCEGIPGEPIPIGGIDHPGKDVRVVGGGRVEREHPPRLDIQHDHRSALLLGKDVVDPLHQLHIHIEIDVRSRLFRKRANAPERPHDPPRCVHLHIAEAGCTLKQRVVLRFEPGPPDDPPRLHATVLRQIQLFLIDLPHAANDMRPDPARRIPPLGAGLDQELGERRPAHLHGRDLVERGVHGDDQGPRIPHARLLLQPSEPLVADLNVFTQPVQRSGASNPPAPAGSRPSIPGRCRPSAVPFDPE